MPPLRLLRHLRPCHPPGSAHQARCASKTARVNFSTDGDEVVHSSPNSHSNTPRDAATQTVELTGDKQSLGTTSIHKLASLDYQKVAQRESPSTRSVGTSPIQAHADNNSEGDQAVKRRKEKGHGRHERELMRSKASPASSEGTFTIHKYVPGESQRSEHTLHQNARVPQQRGVLEIQKQLQYLFQEVKKLQEAVGVRTPIKAASTPARDRETSQTPSSTASSGLTSVSSRSTLYRRAWLRYRKSVYQLVTIANALEGMSSLAASPLASFITQHLRRVAEDAFATNDQGTIGNLGRYKWGINALVAGLDLASPARDHPPTARTFPKTVAPGAADEPGLEVAENRRGTVDEGTPVGDPRARDEADGRHDGQGHRWRIHPQSRSMSSLDHTQTGTDATSPRNSTHGAHFAHRAPRNAGNEPSLLDELFPESSTPNQPRSSEKRDQYPKLDPPVVRPTPRAPIAKSKTLKEQVVESFQNGGEQITALQLSHCSTELTEADFRRVIPKGKHIETWRQDGGLFKIIPGRDPLSLERMPFYYILFRDSMSALAYQKNASRLHKLSALHQPSSILSAIPPPKGFLEDSEDLNAAISSYNLLPTNHQFSLSVVMQPYNPALRALLERGGYQPIVPDTDAAGKRIWKVLLQIDGYEPTPSDLFKIFRTDAFKQGLPVLTLRNESRTSLHRLRDIINLKSNTKLVSSINPRAYGSFDQALESESHIDYLDPGIHALLAGAEVDTSPKVLKQMVMNRVYNRWVVEFADEDAAVRFARRWHRRVLPDLFKDNTWADGEDVRMCSTEVLW